MCAGMSPVAKQDGDDFDAVGWRTRIVSVPVDDDYVSLGAAGEEEDAG